MLKRISGKVFLRKLWIIPVLTILPIFMLLSCRNDRSSQQYNDIAGKVSGRLVSHSEYQDALLAENHQAIILFGEDVPNVKENLNLETRAWERLILLDEAEKRKIKVTAKEVEDLIQSYPFFQENGRFDQTLYLSILKYSFHATPKTFEEETRQNLMLIKLYKTVTAEVTLTEKEIRKEYIKNYETVSIYYICARTDNPSKGEAAFNKQARDKLSACLEKFKKTYNNNPKQEDLAKAARDFGLEYGSTDPFKYESYIEGIGPSDIFWATAKNLKDNAFSQIIEVPSGYYIIRKKSHTPIDEKKFDKDKKEFTQKILLQKQQVAFARILEELKNNIQVNSP